MSTIVLNSHNYPWANWTPTGLSRFSEAGSVLAGTSNLTFSHKATQKVASGQVVLSIPAVAGVDSVCGCAGSILRTGYATVRREFASTSTGTERTEMLAQLRSLVLTSQFESWFLNGVLPV